MRLTSQSQWSGLTYAPFSLPELPFAESAGRNDFITEWSTGVCLEENREAPRRAVCCELFLVDPAWGETENPLPIRGECLNLSSSGLYGVFPIGYGLGVGQSYVFRIQLRDRAGYEPGQLQVISRHGTIVRTEMLFGSEEDRVGLGVRLDGHPE